MVSHFWKDMNNPNVFLKREFGIVFEDVDIFWDWDDFIKKGQLQDVLDIITALFKLAETTSVYSKFRPHTWSAEIQRIFDEERLSYQMDSKGGVRFRVDEAFEAERVSAIVALSGPRYAETRAALDEGFAGLDRSLPDTRSAIRGIFDAAENLFKLMMPGVKRLGASEIERGMGGLLSSVYSGASLDFARMQAKSFREWVNAVHMYRHAQGVEEREPPALDVAISAVSVGTSFIRWLATIDGQLQARTAQPPVLG
jgi:hypothetical protein